GAWDRGGAAGGRRGQGAERAVRTAEGVNGAEARSVVHTQGTARRWEVPVAHADGRQWWVEGRQGASSPPRPECCGSVLGSPARMDVTAIREVTVTSRAC